MEKKDETAAVREATPLDIVWIRDNNCALALESENLTLDPERVLRGVRAVLEEGGKGTYLLALLEEKPVAQLLITAEWSDWQAGHYWWIQSVYVLPEFRGRGLFRRLFEAVVERADALGTVRAIRLYVDVANGVAQTSYRRLGMSPSHYRIFELDMTGG